jgi:hypothetical protein
MMADERRASVGGEKKQERDCGQPQWRKLRKARLGERHEERKQREDGAKGRDPEPSGVVLRQPLAVSAQSA